MVVLMAAVAFAAMALVRLIGAMTGGAPSARDAAAREMTMPNAIQMIAYILLILLMLGVVTGLIGGL